MMLPPVRRPAYFNVVCPPWIRTGPSRETELRVSDRRVSGPPALFQKRIQISGEGMSEMAKEGVVTSVKFACDRVHQPQELPQRHRRRDQGRRGQLHYPDVAQRLQLP